MPIVISTERDENRLTALYDAHYRDLVRLAAVLIDDVGECEELVQDAFARLLGGSVGPGSGREAPYLRSMVLNGARSRLRRRLVRRRHPATVGAPMV
ncbi:MAG: RNA polymerase sigma factor, partial [Acidimicrobiales bacterium]